MGYFVFALANLFYGLFSQGGELKELVLGAAGEDQVTFDVQNDVEKEWVADRLTVPPENNHLVILRGDLLVRP